MLLADEPGSRCSSIVNLLEEKAKRIVSEWKGTFDQLEAKKPKPIKSNLVCNKYEFLRIICINT